MSVLLCNIFADIGQFLLKWLLFPLIQLLATLCDFLFGFWVSLFDGSLIMNLYKQDSIQIALASIIGLCFLILIGLGLYKIVRFNIDGEIVKAKQAAKELGIGFVVLFFFILGTTLVVLVMKELTTGFDTQTSNMLGRDIIATGFTGNLKWITDNEFVGTSSNFGEMDIATNLGADWYKDYNFLIPIITGGINLVVVGFCTYITLKRFFNFVTLLFLGPCSASLYPVHHGDGFKNWSKDFVSVTLTSLIMLVAFFMSSLIGDVITLVLSDLIGNSQGLVSAIVTMLITCLKLSFVVEITNKLAKVFNLNIEISGSMSAVFGGVVSTVKNGIGKVKNGFSSTDVDNDNEEDYEKKSVSDNNTTMSDSWLDNQVSNNSEVVTNNYIDDADTTNVVNSTSSVGNTGQTSANSEINVDDIVSELKNMNIDIDLSPIIDNEVDIENKGVFGENDIDNNDNSNSYFRPNIDNDVEVEPNIDLDIDNQVDYNSNIDIDNDVSAEAPDVMVNDTNGRQANTLLKNIDRTMRDVEENTDKER